MKKNTWNVKRLVDDSFVPSAQQTSKLYSGLTDFLYTCPQMHFGYFEKKQHFITRP
jgi:hypothetical protein